jgi:hypothetical protein
MFSHIDPANLDGDARNLLIGSLFDIFVADERLSGKLSGTDLGYKKKALLHGESSTRELTQELWQLFSEAGYESAEECLAAALTVDTYYEYTIAMPTVFTPEAILQLKAFEEAQASDPEALPTSEQTDLLAAREYVEAQIDLWIDLFEVDFAELQETLSDRTSQFEESDVVEEYFSLFTSVSPEQEEVYEALNTIVFPFLAQEYGSRALFSMQAESGADPELSHILEGILSGDGSGQSRAGEELIAHMLKLMNHDGHRLDTFLARYCANRIGHDPSGLTPPAQDIWHQAQEGAATEEDAFIREMRRNATFHDAEHYGALIGLSAMQSIESTIELLFKEYAREDPWPIDLGNYTQELLSDTDRHRFDQLMTESHFTDSELEALRVLRDRDLLGAHFDRAVLAESVNFRENDEFTREVTASQEPRVQPERNNVIRFPRRPIR